MNYKIILLSIFCYLGLSAQSPLITLFKDLDYYKIYDYKIKGMSRHRMHLLGHSLSVGQRLERWLTTDDDWTNLDFMQGAWGVPSPVNRPGVSWRINFTEREKRCFAFAGYLHDIGKAGDIGYESYVYKENEIDSSRGRAGHECIGLYYALYHVWSKPEKERAKKYLQKNCALPVTALHPYYLYPSGQEYSFKILAKKYGFSLDELRLIAVLIGAHKLLASVWLADEGLKERGTQQEGAELFIEKLAGLIEIAGLPVERLDAKLIKMVEALTAADVYSVFYPARWLPSMFATMDQFEKAIYLQREFDEKLNYTIDGKKMDEKTYRARNMAKIPVALEKFEPKLLESLAQWERHHGKNTLLCAQKGLQV